MEVGGVSCVINDLSYLLARIALHGTRSASSVIRDL
jgi:hypothetical protein